MKIMKKAEVFAAILMLGGCSPKEKPDAQLARVFPHSFEMNVTNPTAMPRNHEAGMLRLAAMKRKFRSFHASAFVVLDGATEIPSQSDLIEKTGDGLKHVVGLRPRGGRLEYGFLAVWE